MNYQEALNYIRNIERTGSDYGIERMRMLLDMLGAPDNSLKFVHVAGTNGKGSVCAYLTSILKEAGYTVGTYNSPSVFCYNERWSLDGEPFCDGFVAKYMSQVKEVIDGENEKRSLQNADNSQADKNANPLNFGAFNPTAFEIETAVALLAFKDLGCDIAVLETGLGGRWDATNAIRDKEVAVITPIGLDHCALLGNTLSEIAEEKAAIIKKDGVTCAQCDEVMQRIFNPYELKNCEKITRDVSVKVCHEPKFLSASRDGQEFEYNGNKYAISMLGAHQLQNASLAICAVQTLREKGWNISENALKNGLEKAIWHARLEIVKNAEQRFNITIPQGKTLVFDGAHNPHGAQTLANAIKDYFGDESIHLVFGMLADKDVDGVVKLLAPLANKVTAVTPDSPRALDKSLLRQKVEVYANCDECNSIRLAVGDALDGDFTTVILCGSLTLFASL